MVKRVETHTEETQAEQQVTNPAEENIISTHTPREGIETENPEYALTKEIIYKLSKEIEAARKRKRTQPQGKVSASLSFQSPQMMTRNW